LAPNRVTNPCAISAPVSFCVPVLTWSAWPAYDGHAFASASDCDLTFIEPLLRRRLSALARMALHVAYACAQERPRLRVVFASRHGELNRTMSMLADLAREQGLSPTAFGLSVHNTAAGLFSIARSDPSAASAVAAGEETFAYALLEAWVQFQSEPDQPVLVVYADEPLPQAYRHFAERTEQAHAIGLLLHDSAARRLSVTFTASGERRASEEAQSISFLRSLTSGAGGSWTGSQRTWAWH
jgi:hypothetical protein